MRAQANLHLNTDTGRWEIGEYELHCGDCFELFSDKRDKPEPIPVRIEHCSAGWYLISEFGILQVSKRLARI
jgi:hypothetical protein